MSFTDLAVGFGIFIFFFGVTLMLTINYFTNVPATETIAEFREKAVDLFDKLFSSRGTPENWEDTSEAPSELGLATTIYAIPITVKEKGTGNRVNEPVVLKLIFDDDCSNITWNNTIRIYDESFNETKYELVHNISCSDQFLNQSYIKFNVNISQNDNKRYFVYFSEDIGIPAPNYSISYSTSSWQPNDGDAWSDSTTSWNRYGGSTGSVELNSTDSWRSSSIQVGGAFDSNKLGLEYNPSSNITGVNNSWYIDAWLYVDDVTSLSNVNVSISDNSDVIYTNISDIVSSTWYHFEKALTSSVWDDWNNFNASMGIDYVRFYLVNSTSGLTKTIKVDEFHFEIEPLEVKDFPVQNVVVISRKKVSALGNYSFDELKDILGEDYKFRIEITGD